MRRRRRGSRLDQPRLRRRSTLRPNYEADAFGRIAERVARFIGTARFLVIQSAIVVVWVGYNFLAPRSLRFDNYPFIFLTLALSLQAVYAAPLILLAQNRQDDRDRANLAQDREQTGRTRDDTEYLAREVAAMRITIGELATRDFLRSELRGLMTELEGSEAERDRRERRRRRDEERSARKARDRDRGRDRDGARDPEHVAGRPEQNGDGRRARGELPPT